MCGSTSKVLSLACTHFVSKSLLTLAMCLANTIRWAASALEHVNRTNQQMYVVPHCISNIRMLHTNINTTEYCHWSIWLCCPRPYTCHCFEEALQRQENAWLWCCGYVGSHDGSLRMWAAWEFRSCHGLGSSPPVAKPHWMHGSSYRAVPEATASLRACADGADVQRLWDQVMMMIAFITFSSSLVPLIQGLCGSNPWEFEFSGFRRNQTDDLGINSLLLWPTEPRLHVRSMCCIHFWVAYSEAARLSSVLPLPSESHQSLLTWPWAVPKLSLNLILKVGLLPQSKKERNMDWGLGRQCS